MEYRQMGRSGLPVSVLGLGCNNFGMRIDAAATRKVVDAALEHGVSFFDTSDSYGGGKSEEFLGAALEGRRDDVVIATKFASRMGEGPYRIGASRRYVVRACEASLQRLGTDHIDLYYIHRPDPNTPIEETLAALDDLVTAGKVRYIGSSNFAGWQVADAEHIARDHGWSRFIASQVEWSLLARGVEAEHVRACRHFDVGVVPYFPLASGLLTGKYQRGKDYPEGSRLAAAEYFRGVATDANFDKVERLTAFATEHGHAITDLALSWLACRPEVASVLVGATRPEQVAANVNAISWQLSAGDMAAVDDALTGA